MDVKTIQTSSRKHTRNKITSFGNMIITPKRYKSIYVVKVRLYKSNPIRARIVEKSISLHVFKCY
jgi:hypothetical protein